MSLWHAGIHWMTNVPAASYILSHWSIPALYDGENESEALYLPGPVVKQMFILNFMYKLTSKSIQRGHKINSMKEINNVEQ